VVGAAETAGLFTSRLRRFGRDDDLFSDSPGFDRDNEVEVVASHFASVEMTRAT
jgi:hypothetical protein